MQTSIQTHTCALLPLFSPSFLRIFNSSPSFPSLTWRFEKGSCNALLLHTMAPFWMDDLTSVWYFVTLSLAYCSHLLHMCTNGVKEVGKNPLKIRRKTPLLRHAISFQSRPILPFLKSRSVSLAGTGSISRVFIFRFFKPGEGCRAKISDFVIFVSRPTIERFFRRPTGIFDASQF